MPHDIFISYSSLDREKAEQLTELLASAGLSVWIDQSGIEIATSWSKEIVQGIDTCKAFIVLLSSHSIESVNVVREVSLASEKKKKILPLELEPVQLPQDLQYHLAGIQRASMTNIDAIIRALGKLGLEATQAPSLKLVKETDSRKSLMILPFEDLSPTADNQWFADGLATELIAALSNVKSLRVTDQQTTKEFKNFKGHLTTYAKEMSIRYFIQGSVRKFGDQIKITSALLDIESGDHLWQDSLKGTMDDIFDIQEMVAKKVVEGLHVILTADEEQKIGQRQTGNTDAYELWLKGQEYYARTTRMDFERALTLYEEAVVLDPSFVAPHLDIADTILEIYDNYDRESRLLQKAQGHIDTAEAIEGETARVDHMRCKLFLRRGDANTALTLSIKAIERQPEYAKGYLMLCQAYRELSMWNEAADAARRAAELLENDRNTNFNYLISLNEIGATEELKKSAIATLPLFERYVRLTPDDIHARVRYVNTLNWAGEKTRSNKEAEKLEASDIMDGFALYNLACHYLHQEELAKGMSLLRRAVDQGLIYLEGFRRDPDLAPLQGTPEFEALIKEIEQKIEAEKAKS